MTAKAHDYPLIYKDLGIDLNTLGCVMLDVEPFDLSFIDESDLYHTADKAKFWINGAVGAKTAHATLRYGLLPGVRREHVDAVLDGVSLDRIDLRGSEVDVFDSPLESEPYACLVLRLNVNINLNLVQANARLGLLPNVNTYAEYKPHITLAYVKDNYKTVKRVVDQIDSHTLANAQRITKRVTTGLNYGDRIV